MQKIQKLKPHVDVDQEVAYTTDQPSENIQMEKGEFDKSYFNYNDESVIDRFFEPEEQEYKSPQQTAFQKNEDTPFKVKNRNRQFTFGKA